MAEKLIDAAVVNKIIEEETIRCVAALKAEQSRLGINSVSGELSKIKYKLLRKDTSGVYTRIRFIFPRYGVFIHKGASRGHAGSKGSQWKNRKDITIRTDERSFGKMNRGSRRAKEWFNDVIENFGDILTTRLEDYFIEIAYDRLIIK